MADSVNVCIRFNSGNPQIYKVGYINVTLKGLKDQINEINQELNIGDTRRWKTFGMNVQCWTMREYGSGEWN